MKLLNILGYSLAFVFLYASSAYGSYYIKNNSKGPTCIGVSKIHYSYDFQKGRAEIIAMYEAMDDFNECMNKYIKDNPKKRNMEFYIIKKKAIIFNPKKMSLDEAVRKVF